MERLPRIPVELTQGISDPIERQAREGRFRVLQELGYFGLSTNIRLATKDEPGTFNALVRRHFSNTFGNTDGCEAGDIEVAAEYLGVFDDIYNVEASQTSKYIQDR